jgi:hypothetical protein
LTDSTIGIGVELKLGKHALIAKRAEHDPLCARHVQRLQPLGFDPVEQVLT